MPVREGHPEFGEELKDQARKRRIGQAVAMQPGWDSLAEGNVQNVHHEGGGMAVGAEPEGAPGVDSGS